MSHRRQPPDLGYVTGACSTGKRCYFTRAGARAAVRKMKSKGEKRLHAYLCDSCNHHHIGHQPYVVSRGIQTASEWRATR